VVAHLPSVDPAAARALFRKLKFLRLLHTVHRDGGGWRIELDGPFSLFDSVTKYGLALALSLPAIAACGRHRIEADVRWGKARQPLRFVLQGERLASHRRADARLSDDAEALRAKLSERDGEWRVSIADVILDLPGEGVCIPDLVLVHRKTTKRVFVEVMGYWSRDAVWKRVELVERGLVPDGAAILFCAGARLRVSEAVLPETSPAALLVYKGVIAPSAVEEKAALLAARSGRARG
jgi:predicted nuclease of restriction endonuclease-like RecB superfamily